MKISNLYCSEMVPEETKKRCTHTHKFAVWKKVNGKAVHAIQRTEMSNDSFGWYSISLSLILCVMFDFFFMFHGGVGVRRARNSFYLLLTHYEYVCPMNCYNGITVKMHDNGLYTHAHQFIIFVVFLCVFSLLIPFGNALNTNLIWICRLMLN